MSNSPRVPALTGKDQDAWIQSEPVRMGLSVQVLSVAARLSMVTFNGMKPTLGMLSMKEVAVMVSRDSGSMETLWEKPPTA